VSIPVAVTLDRSIPLPERLLFLAPPPGMVGLERFTLAPLDEAGLLFALRSDDDPSVRLFVIPPVPYFPDYAPDLGRDTRETLGDDVVLLTVVSPGADGDPHTVNLLAPVVVAPDGRALQVVLEGDAWPLRAPLTAAGSAA